MIIIYALCHPVTHEIRYIGKTKNKRNRLIQHKYEAFNRKGHFHQWKKSIYESGNTPEFIDLELTANWEESEMFWIAMFKSLGARLLNSTNGGLGVKGLVYTNYIRKNLSAGQLGRRHSEETKAKIALASSRYKHTEETKEKLRNRILTKEHIENNARAHSKLPETTVLGIFGDCLCGNFTIKQIALKYNTSEATVCRIKLGKSYKWVHR